MDQGGPTDNREPYFKDAVDEMMRARTLCAKANACMAAPGLRIATINHDMNERHTTYTYGKVTVGKNAWLGMT